LKGSSSLGNRDRGSDSFTPPDPRKEVVCVEGTLGQAMQTLRSIDVNRTMGIIWKPPSASESWTMVDVWKFRSLGLRGIVLDSIDSELYRKLKRPCSAMDYPPTIYMIGEDEIT
jgi:hypothetical protein